MGDLHLGLGGSFLSRSVPSGKWEENSSMETAGTIASVGEVTLHPDGFPLKPQASR